MPCQNEYTSDNLIDFSLVGNEMILGRKDLENSPFDAGLVASAFTSPCRELNSICSDVDESFSSPERQTFSVAKMLTPTALADASNVCTTIVCLTILTILLSIVIRTLAELSSSPSLAHFIQYIT